MAATQLLRPGHVIRARGESWVVHRHVAGTHGSVLDVRGRGPDNRGTRACFCCPSNQSSGCPRLTRHESCVHARGAGSRDRSSPPPHRRMTHSARRARGDAGRPSVSARTGARGRSRSRRHASSSPTRSASGRPFKPGLIISELLERRPESHVLVVTPAGLRPQWQTELRERFTVEATLLDSTSITRHATQWNGNPWSIPGVVLTSLDYVKRPEVVRALESLVWDLVVFDEAHALAGRSDRAIAAAMLAQRARTVVLLTATPHSGDDQAFSRLTSLGDFSNRFPLLVFRRTRLDVGMVTARRTVSIRVRPTPHESEMHRALMSYARLVWTQSSATSGARLAMTVLTRRACSSAWSLARSVETRLRLLSLRAHPICSRCRFRSTTPPPMTSHHRPSWARPDSRMPTKKDEGSSTCFDWRSRPRRTNPSYEHFVVYSAGRASRRSCSPSIATHCINSAHLLRDFSPVLLHGGMTHQRAAGGAQAIRQRRRTSAARDRRRQRGPQPSSPMPPGDQSRAAVDAGPPGAAYRAGGPHRTGEARSRRAPARGRHMRRGIGRRCC